MPLLEGDAFLLGQLLYAVLNFVADVFYEGAEPTFLLNLVGCSRANTLAMTLFILHAHSLTPRAHVLEGSDVLDLELVVEEDHVPTNHLVVAVERAAACQSPQA